MSTSTTVAGPAAAGLTEQYCTFWVDGLFFGVAVAEVQEVIRHQPMTPVPRAHDAVRGLINLRGQIVTAVDLRVRLDLQERPADQPPMNVIVRCAGEVVSLLVDDIGDVIDAGDRGGAAPVPPNLPLALRDVVREVRPLPDAILLVLDVDRTLDLSIHDTETTGGTP